MRQQIALVGIGGAGCAIIQHYSALNSDQESVIIGVNSDQEALKRNGDNFTRSIYLKSHIFGGRYGAYHADADKTELQHLLRMSVNTAFVVGLGGQTGTRVLRYMAEHFPKEKGHRKLFAVTLPFAFEAERRQFMKPLYDTLHKEASNHKFSLVVHDHAQEQRRFVNDPENHAKSMEEYLNHAANLLCRQIDCALCGSANCSE